MRTLLYPEKPDRAEKANANSVDRTARHLAMLAALLTILIAPFPALASLGILQQPTIDSAVYDNAGVITIRWHDHSTSAFYQVRWQKGTELTSSAHQDRDSGIKVVNGPQCCIYGIFKLLASDPGPYSFIVQGCLAKQFVDFGTDCSTWSTLVTVNIPAETATKTVSYSWPSRSEGDCQMQNAQIVFRSDGSALFSAQVKTNHTHSGDVWHIDIKGLDGSKKIMVDLGDADSPTMSDDHGWYNWSHSYQYDGNSFPQIQIAQAHDSC